ncbi:MAG: NUDIX domain-containing protein [Desulfuromonadaceae bacterium]|nr:NUDIX domain-containing protein [Desulfuromonadaceae bacterium]MDD5105044.1 NUDIX domain-containing protein [Desulfuromonadaceae bacterium]
MTRKQYKKEHIVTSVVAVIVDDEGRVLLTRRSIPPFLDQWVMPGGKVELGEPLLDALKREVHEEVGLEVEVEGLIDVFEHLTPGEENCHFVILYYRCRPLYCDVVHNEHEVTEYAWVSGHDLLEYAMPAGARFILGQVFPAFCPVDKADVADA